MEVKTKEEYISLNKQTYAQRAKELQLIEDPLDRAGQLAYNEECLQYTINKVIPSAVPNGKPVLTLLPFCSKPVRLGGDDASNGARVCYGGKCKSAKGIANIINSCREMDIIQLVDKNDPVPIDSPNVRKCDKTDAQIKQEIEERERWGCNHIRQAEADYKCDYLEAKVSVFVVHVKNTRTHVYSQPLYEYK